MQDVIPTLLMRKGIGSNNTPDYLGYVERLDYNFGRILDTP